MSNSDWPGGPPEYPMPREAPPSHETFGKDWLGTRTTYDGWTRQPVFYYPVTLRGALLGYLYASVTHNSAGFIRNLPARISELSTAELLADPSWRAVDTWGDRLKACYSRGLSAQDAVRSWIGVPEDPKGGGILADAAEGRSETLEGLNQSLNPGAQPVPSPLIQDGTYPDGTPVDRSQGWGPLISSPLRRYPVETAGSVRFYTVTKEGGALGFVWAALAGDGADYLPYGPAGRHGEIAAGLWQLWLSRAFEAGYTPLEALEYCRTQPEDWMSGVIGPDAQAGEFPTLAELKDWAR
ncbi:hypothetical protein ABIA39_004714 [Nocardia sp. GAS34]|uniref:hypothetical protein n=1 Tax=Nocardia sp. GAS34 TaxID=3156305 RepID=UPI003D22D43F